MFKTGKNFENKVWLEIKLLDKNFVLKKVNDLLNNIKLIFYFNISTLASKLFFKL